MFDRNGGRKYLNEAERQAFFKAATTEPHPIRRNFCLTLLYTGCRISEALKMGVGNLDSPQKSVVFETLKRRRRGVFRDVPVPEPFLNALLELAAQDDRLWPLSRPTGYRLVKEIMTRAGIAGPMASPKGLRHGFAVACIAKGVPLPTIQKWLGHARLETTAIYLGVSGEEERNLARRLWF